MGRLGQALSGVTGRVRRRPVRAAALSAGVAGAAALVAISLSFGGGTGTPSAAGAGPPPSELLVSPLLTSWHSVPPANPYSIPYSVYAGIT